MRALTLVLCVLAVLSIGAGPADGAAPAASGFQLPPRYEFLALTAGPEGEAFVATAKFGGPFGDVFAGKALFEVDPAGKIAKFGTVKGEVQKSGMAPGPEKSVWVPTESGVARVGRGGVEARAAIAHGEINGLTSDFSGGIWLVTPSVLAHVDAGGQLTRFPGVVPPGSGCCAAATDVVADQAGNVWLTIVRGRLPATKEVIEREASGQVRRIAIATSFPASTSIGVGATSLVLQGGSKFLETGLEGGRSRRIGVPSQACLGTSTAEIWCQRGKSLSRVFPRGEASAATLPGPSFPIRQLAVGGPDQLWYAAQNHVTCAGGPSGCATESPVKVVVGEIASPTL